MTNEEETIRNTIVDVLAKATGKAAAELTPTTNVASLGLTSLDVLDLILRIEALFGFEIPDGQLDDLSGKTIDDLAQHIAQLRSRG